jgi:hypothetical protein
MKNGMVAVSVLGLAASCCCLAARAGDASAKPSENAAKQSPASAGPSKPQEYLLRYQFHAGDALRWTVVHRCRINTTVSGSTQTADTTTTSIKLWRVHAVKPDGSIVFDHMVQSVDMRHRLSGRGEVHYNSRTDFVPPHGFEDVARAVGVPLAVVRIDNRGKILERKQNFVKAAVAGQGEITIQLPEQAVAAGGRWSSVNNLDVPLSDGSVKRLRAMQSFCLESVKTGVATISMSTQILTPINDPAIEAQVLQYETCGTIRFDIDRGQILGRQIDIDKSVVGFRGEASSIRYIGRSTEERLAPEAKVAAK